MRQIHTRMNYLAKECGFTDTDTPPSFKVHGLCICCVQKLQPHDKSEVAVSPKTQGLYIRCNGFAWLCRARDKLITTRRMTWNPKWLMKKELYNGIVIPPYIATTIKPQLYPTPSLSTEHAHRGCTTWLTE